MEIILSNAEILSNDNILNPIEKRREYMRNYMKTRYNDEKEKGRKYQRSICQKRNKNLNPEIWTKYKENYADIVKLLKAINNLPPELVIEIINNPIALSV